MAFQNILENCSLLRSRFLGYHATLSPPFLWECCVTSKKRLRRSLAKKTAKWIKVGRTDKWIKVMWNLLACTFHKDSWYYFYFVSQNPETKTDLAKRTDIHCDMVFRMTRKS